MEVVDDVLEAAIAVDNGDGQSGGSGGGGGSGGEGVEAVVEAMKATSVEACARRQKHRRVRSGKGKGREKEIVTRITRNYIHFQLFDLRQRE